jgi:hypothetical protein
MRARTGGRRKEERRMDGENDDKATAAAPPPRQVRVSILIGARQGYAAEAVVVVECVCGEEETEGLSERGDWRVSETHRELLELSIECFFEAVGYCWGLIDRCTARITVRSSRRSVKPSTVEC